MAPPMAAEALARPSFTIEQLAAELCWSGGPGWSGEPGKAVDVGLVETAGGVRSPIAGDGDCLALVAALSVDLAVLVADAGLGTINSVRLAVTALSALPPTVAIIVFLNRFDPGDDLHTRNRDWLRHRDGLTVLTSGEEDRLVDLVRGDP